MRKLVLSLRSPAGYCALVLAAQAQRQPTLSLSGGRLFSRDQLVLNYLSRHYLYSQ